MGPHADHSGWTALLRFPWWAAVGPSPHPWLFKGEKTESQRQGHLPEVTQLGPDPMRCTPHAGFTTSSAVNLPLGPSVHECRLLPVASREVSQRLFGLHPDLPAPHKLRMRLCRCSSPPPGRCRRLRQAHSSPLLLLLSRQSGRGPKSRKEFPGDAANSSGNVLRRLQPNRVCFSGCPPMAGTGLGTTRRVNQTQNLGGKPNSLA